MSEIGSNFSGRSISFFTFYLNFLKYVLLDFAEI